jgi:hypothetical protein
VDAEGEGGIFLRIVIPGRDEVASYDAQLRIGESMTTRRRVGHIGRSISL